MIHKSLKQLITIDNEQGKSIKVDNKTCIGQKEKYCNQGALCKWVQHPTKENNGRCAIRLPEEWAELFEGKIADLLLKRVSQINKTIGKNTNNNKDIVFDQNGARVPHGARVWNRE